MSAVSIAGYSDLTEIGRGGFGVVYRATQTDLGRPVAIKVLPGIHENTEAYARFLRECRTLGAVGTHPNIATVYGAGLTDAGDGYLVMELLEGGSLSERIAAGPLSETEVAAIGVGLAGALETAHRAGVLHRDVKPQNIMFDRLDHPTLLDFGIASMPGAFQTNSASTSMTLAHAAPEIVAGAKGTAAADVYSLSSTLFACLAGGAPYARDGEETLVPLLARIASEPVPDLRERGVSDELASIIEAGMAKDPAVRTASAAELGMALSAYLNESGVPDLGPAILNPSEQAAAVAVAVASDASEATAPKGATTAPLHTRRRRGVLAAIAGVAALAVVAAGVALAARGDDTPTTLAGDPSSIVASSTGAAPTSRPASSATEKAEPGASGAADTGTGGAPAAPGGAPGVTDSGAPATSATRQSGGGSASRKAAGSAVTVPGPPGAGTVGFLAALDRNGSGEPTRVRLSVSWSAPSSGSAPTAYVVRAVPRNSSTAKVQTVIVSSAGATITVPAMTSPAGYYEWTVAARNSAGTSAPTTLPARVVDMTGESCPDAAQMARASGLRTYYAAEATPGSRDQEYTVAAQSPAGGTYQPGGKAVTITCYQGYA